MTTEQPPEESSQPTTPMLNPPFTTLRRPERMTQTALPQHPDHQAMLELMRTTPETRYIALDVSASTFSVPAADRDGAVENLYNQMGYEGTDDTYTSTIVIIEVSGNPFLVRSLGSLFYNAGYMRLQSYRPDPKAKRRDAQAADVDKSERKH